MRALKPLLPVCLALWAVVSSAIVRADAPTARTGVALVLADPDDPYYRLAGEIARVEGLDLSHSLDDALAREPRFLLWVVSPERLSDDVLVAFGRATGDRPAAVSIGIITGSALEDARALWQRAGQAGGTYLVAANAANLAARIEAGITRVRSTGSERQPLTRSNLLDSLENADYLTFTGHGGTSWLGLDEETQLRAAQIPALPPIVVATGSCNTFRPWERDSIALAFTDQGAAAYAGFAYSPNEGYLIGEFDGLPFRFTWPEFPIGHVVQLQNRGARQGFAAFSYYLLLGDPRIALQEAPPYHLVETSTQQGVEIRHYAGAPAGLIPLRVPGGARYAFVRIPGAGAAWQGDLFYNARLQMIDAGDNKLILFAHKGGDFAVELHERPPWLSIAGDIMLDALDGTLIYLQTHGGAVVMTGAGVLALISIFFLLARKKGSPRTLGPAALLGLGFAALHSLYVLFRLEAVTITSKPVFFTLLSPVSTFLLAGAGAFLFLNARSWRGRLLAVIVAALPAWAPALFLISILGVLDNAFTQAQLGTDLWNCRPGLQPLLTAIVLSLLFWGASQVAARQVNRGPMEVAKA